MWNATAVNSVELCDFTCELMGVDCHFTVFVSVPSRLHKLFGSASLLDEAEVGDCAFAFSPNFPLV